MSFQNTIRIDFKRVLDEHQRLQEALQEIRFRLARRHVNQGEVAIFFVDLHEHLENHFSHEELGGYFADVVEILPQWKDQVEKLRQQHPQLLQCLEEVQKSLESFSSRTSWRVDIASLFEMFVQQFIAHERRENDLIQEAYSRDYGLGD